MSKLTRLASNLPFLMLLLLIPVSLFAQQPDRCDAILKQGVFDEDAVARNATFQNAVDDYIYQSDIGTREQASAAGFGLTFPIYGVPVTGSADFSNSDRETWRKEYENKHQLRTASSDTYSSLLKQANANVVNAWLACVSLPSSDQGLISGLKASGTNYVYFWIRYDQLRTNAAAPVISFIQTTGVDDSSHPIKVGDTIPLEASGLGGLYRVTDPYNVTILVRATDASGNPRGTVAPHINLTSAKSEAAGTFVSGGPIVGEVRAIAFGGDKSSSQIANLRKQGWLECAGQALNVLQYPELYDAIRETWGTPAKGVAFNVPNLSGEFLRGWNDKTAIPTPDANIDPDDGLTTLQSPSRPGDPDVATRIASQSGGATGDAVGSFQDAHLQNFPHTISGKPIPINPAALPPNCCAYYVTKNPHQGDFYSDLPAEDANHEGHDIAPKNVYVLYVIYVGRPVLDSTP